MEPGGDSDQAPEVYDWYLEEFYRELFYSGRMDSCPWLPPGEG